MSNSEIKRSWAEEVEEAQTGNKTTQKKIRTDSENSSCARKKIKLENINSDKQRQVDLADEHHLQIAGLKIRPPRKPLDLETNPLILQRRQKQINYGKNTVGYHNYIQKVSLDTRTKECPKTPDKYLKYSRRSWDTLIKIWRKKLHEYDPNIDECSDFDEDSDDDSTVAD